MFEPAGPPSHSPADFGSDLQRLREKARERVERTSLWHVASSAGMGPDTLRRFLAEGPIASRRRTRLARWLRETQRIADARAEACVAMVLEVVSDLDEPRRMKAVRAVMAALREQFKQGVGAAALAARPDRCPGRRDGG